MTRNKDANPTHIYVGRREAVMAEVGTPDYYTGKYLISPYGEGRYDSDGCATLAETREQVKWWKRTVPGIKVVWL
jgi:hypothetical protein